MTKFSAARFDDQAETHDLRTRIPEDCCLEIAQTVARLTNATSGDLLVDLGAGTGLPGGWFPDVGFRYVGIDASEGMLRIFTERRPLRPDSVQVYLSDVDQRWPVDDATASVVFSSRAAHLFDVEHLVDETLRVTKPDAFFVLGRVERDDDSMRRRLRDEMRACLRRRGFDPTDAPKRHAKISDAFRNRGAEPLSAQVAATWTARHSAADVLGSWTKTTGLGGCAVDPRVKKEILTELWAWAETQIDSVWTALPSEERFTLTPMRLRKP